MFLMPVSACTNSGANVASGPSIATADKHRGMAFEHAWGRRSRTQGYGSEASASSLGQLKDLGATWISVTPFGFQRNVDDTSFRWGGPETEKSDDRVHRVTGQAHQQGIKVMLKPHIWLRPPAWVGLVQSRTERDWSTWFSNYRQFIVHYASLAQEADVDALCIGNELGGTTHREREWRELIADVRAVYDGVLTYGAHADELWDVAFWDALDFIGVSAYFELALEPSPTYGELVDAWGPIVTRLERLSSRWHRSVLFTEIGYRSVDFAAQYPWKYDGTTPVNLRLQADAYTAFFEAVWDKPWLGGVYWWKWRSAGAGGGPDDDNYTPRGKPAENVLRRYFMGEDAR